MNDRLGRTLTLLAVLFVAGPATTYGADSGNTSSTAGRASSAQDTAAEAQRLANLASELSKQAAALAAESQQSAPPPASAASQANPAAGSPQGSPAASANGAQSSDADQTSTNAPATSGWRSHRKMSDLAIHFMGDETPSAPSTNKAAAPAPLGPQSQSGAIADGQFLKDSNVQLAAGTYNNGRVQRADNPEPMPAPEPPQNNGNDARPIHNNGNNGNGLNNSSDATCNIGCCEPQPVLFWTAGVEATFLSPDLNDAGVTFEVDEFAKNRADVFSSASNDVDSVYLTPRIWLGVQGCKWGANVRYWHMQAGEGFFDPSLGIDGEWDGPGCGKIDIGSFSCSQLEAYTIDLEVTRRLCLYDCWMQLSLGVRHAEVTINESIVGNALADDSNVTAFARSNAVARGTGVVLGWYGRRPVFPCSCVNWFYNFHWSALWGPTETSAETGIILSATDPNGVADAGSTNGAETFVDDVLFIGEIQLGLEWDYCLRCMPANAFFRAALEYQRWDSGKGFSSSDSFAGVEVNNVPTTFSEVTSAAVAPQMDLIGISLGTGLTW